MDFDYKAVSAEGRLVSGRLGASNLDDLELRLKRMGIELIAGQPAAGWRLAGRGKAPRREIINFCFHLEQLSRSGIPLLEGLADLRDSLENPRFRPIVGDLIERIEGGQPLSQAMAAHPRAFDRIFTSLVQAGEASGRLPEVLASLGEALKWEDELSAQNRKIVIYPALVGTIVVAATAFLLLHLIPQLRQFVHSLGQALPLHTRLLFALSDFLRAWWPLLLALPLAALIALQILLRRDPRLRLLVDRSKLALPLVGAIHRKISLSRLSATLAMLYAAGIPILEALRLTRAAVGNRAIEQALGMVEEAIRDGSGLARACADAGVFPPLLVRMLRIGETTGGLDTALRNAAYFYTRDVREAIARMQALIEPVLTLFMGILLGWIMLSIIGPIYDLIAGFRM